jgi:hypothetical protein
MICWVSFIHAALYSDVRCPVLSYPYCTFTMTHLWRFSYPDTIVSAPKSFECRRETTHGESRRLHEALHCLVVASGMTSLSLNTSTIRLTSPRSGMIAVIPMLTTSRDSMSKGRAITHKKVVPPTYLGGRKESKMREAIGTRTLPDA